MNNRKLIYTIVLTFVLFNGKAQIIDTSNFNKLINKEYLPYKDSKGQFLGCGYTFECSGFAIVFYSIKLYKKRKRLVLKGRIIDPRSSSDSSGIYAVNILLAKPQKSTLSKVRHITSSYTRELKSRFKNKFPKRNGDFIAEMKFDLKDKIYFLHGLFRPIEIDIGKLLK